ncbi:hypothetical protein VTO73DRAFT_14739 [Trametes versicolor]
MPLTSRLSAYPSRFPLLHATLAFTTIPHCLNIDGARFPTSVHDPLPASFPRPPTLSASIATSTPASDPHIHTLDPCPHIRINPIPHIIYLPVRMRICSFTLAPSCFPAVLSLLGISVVVCYRIPTPEAPLWSPFRRRAVVE